MSRTQGYGVVDADDEVRRRTHRRLGINPEAKIAPLSTLHRHHSSLGISVVRPVRISSSFKVSKVLVDDSDASAILSS